jgi:hypothetical protein
MNSTPLGIVIMDNNTVQFVTEIYGVSGLSPIQSITSIAERSTHQLTKQLKQIGGKLISSPELASDSAALKQIRATHKKTEKVAVQGTQGSQSVTQPNEPSLQTGALETAPPPPSAPSPTSPLPEAAAAAALVAEGGTSLGPTGTPRPPDFRSLPTSGQPTVVESPPELPQPPQAAELLESSQLRLPETENPAVVLQQSGSPSSQHEAQSATATSAPATAGAPLSRVGWATMIQTTAWETLIVLSSCCAPRQRPPQQAQRSPTTSASATAVTPLLQASRSRSRNERY